MSNLGEKVFVDLIIPKVKSKTITLVKDITLVLIFCLLTAISAKIKIDIGLVPITFQTFAVLLSGALLGKGRAALSQILYLLFGILGIPWFSRGGGISYILSPTFGYIVGFVFAAFFVGWLCERGWQEDVKRAILGMVLGNIVIYIFGLSYLLKFVPFENLLKVGLYPFLLGDLLKILLAGSAVPFGWKIVKKS